VGDAFRRGALGALVERPVGVGQPVRPDPNEVRKLEESGKLIPPVCIVVPDALTGLQHLAAFWRRRYPACRVIGITGSVGKTTAKEMTAAVLSRRYRTLKSEGNYNNEIGLPLTVLKMSEKHERAVLEMAMYDLGEIAQLAEIALPSVGVVTNVGPTHLERLGSIERIAQAKAELIQALPPDGIAVLNGDDPRVRAMASTARVRRVMTYGLGPDVDLRATKVRTLGLEGVSFHLRFQGQVIPARTVLPGGHSVQTALAAVAVGLVEGLSWDEILAGLSDPSTIIRLKPLSGLHGSTILDDSYNSSPASATAALDLLAELEGRKIAVLGDMLELGPYEDEGHRLVGRRVAEVVSRLYVVGPRARIIGEEARARGMPATCVHFMMTNADVVSDLRNRLRPGDIVLVKGSRGMAMEQIVAALRADTKQRNTNHWQGKRA